MDSGNYFYKVNNIYYAILLCIYIIFIENYVPYLLDDNIKHKIFIGGLILEYLIINTLLNLFIRNKYFYLLISFLYSLILIIQALSLQYSGEFISVLALENLTEGTYVGLGSGTLLVTEISILFIIYAIVLCKLKK